MAFYTYLNNNRMTSEWYLILSFANFSLSIILVRVKWRIQDLTKEGGAPKNVWSI